jgi:hypothetical protein
VLLASWALSNSTVTVELRLGDIAQVSQTRGVGEAIAEHWGDKGHG